MNVHYAHEVLIWKAVTPSSDRLTISSAVYNIYMHNGEECRHDEYFVLLQMAVGIWKLTQILE